MCRTGGRKEHCLPLSEASPSFRLHLALRDPLLKCCPGAITGRERERLKVGAWPWLPLGLGASAECL